MEGAIWLVNNVSLCLWHICIQLMHISTSLNNNGWAGLSMLQN